jgi:peptide/nickel transport system permease protein
VQILIRRIGGALVLWWLVLTVTFVLMHLAPGDASTMLIPPGATGLEAAAVRTELGLDAPLPVQYARWLRSVLSGDLGESFAYRRPVTAVLADALPISLALGGISIALSFLVGVAIGMLQGVRRGSWTDTTLTVLTTAVYAAPTFWVALSLIAVFTYGASQWGFPPALRLPAFGVSDPAGQYAGFAALLDYARHAVLPVTVLAAVGAAGIARYARSSVADVVSMDFVRTARAKGVPRLPLYFRHVLKNVLPPMIVLLALSLPGIVAGSVFVETVFSWPGMGRTMLIGILGRDYPVVMGATVLYAGLVIAANLAADLAVPLVDPRRRA